MHPDDDSIYDPPNTKAYKLLDHIAKLGNDDYILRALKWMNDYDPKGRGRLHKPTNSISFDFTDGSKVKLDLATGLILEVQ